MSNDKKKKSLLSDSENIDNNKNYSLERNEILSRFNINLNHELDDFLYLIHSKNFSYNYDYDEYSIENLDEFFSWIEKMKKIEFENLSRYLRCDTNSDANIYFFVWEELFLATKKNNMPILWQINYKLEIISVLATIYQHLKTKNSKLFFSVFKRTLSFLENAEEYGFTFGGGVLSYSEETILVSKLEDKNLSSLYSDYLISKTLDSKIGILIQIQKMCSWNFKNNNKNSRNILTKFFTNDFLTNFNLKIQGYLRHDKRDTCNNAVIQKYEEFQNLNESEKILELNNILSVLLFSCNIIRNIGLDPFNKGDEK